MISAILSLLGSSAVGSLLGGFFAWLNRKNDIEVKKMELGQEEKRWGHELAVGEQNLRHMAAELAARKDIAVVEGDSAVEAARMRTIAEVQNADRVTAEEIKAAGKWAFLLTFALGFNKMIRPIATILLTIAALWINVVLIRKLTAEWEMLSATQQYDLGMQAFAWITGQAAAVLSYWFVSRGSSK